MDKFVILPSNNDLNRGDQALIWQTIEIAREAGFDGEFYMLAEHKKLTKQSQEIGIKVISPILKHPGRMYKTKDNSRYTFGLIVKWGLVAVVDLLKSLLLFFRLTRRFGILFLSDAEKKALKIIGEAKFCFVKGGGFIHSSGKVTDPYTIYYSLYHIALAQKLKKQIFVMPNSFGPFKGFLVEKMVRKVLGKCKIVTARESISSDMLKNINVTNNVFPDLGFYLKKQLKDYKEVCEIRKKYSEYRLVAITVRPYRFPNSVNPTEKYRNYIESLVKFSEWLYSNNCLPIFVEHTLSENTHENDGTAIFDITKKLKKYEYEIISNSEYTCKDLKSIYSNLDFVVGTRFHSVIFSLAESIPALAITYGGNKGQGIMQDMDLSEYYIPINSVNIIDLIEKFELLITNSDVVKQKISIYLDRAVELRETLINCIKDVSETL